MVEGCGGWVETDVGGGGVRVVGGWGWLIWLGVLGMDVNGKTFPAWSFMLYIGILVISNIFISLRSKYQRP